MDKKPSKLLKFFAFIGVIAVIAGIAYMDVRVGPQRS